MKETQNRLGRPGDTAGDSTEPQALSVGRYGHTGWGCVLVVRVLPTMHHALGFIPSTP